MVPLICCIDGNIGAGKTTVLDELEKRGYYVFRENIDSWSFLNKFYSNQKRWAFTFQVDVLYSLNIHHREMLSISNESVVFIERSPSSGLIFSKINYEGGHMTFDELKLIESMYKNIGWSPDITMVLNTPVYLCYDRMKRRQRDCEKNISVSYLEDLDAEYDKLRKSNKTIDYSGSIHDIADRIIANII